VFVRWEALPSCAFRVNCLFACLPVCDEKKFMITDIGLWGTNRHAYNLSQDLLSCIHSTDTNNTETKSCLFRSTQNSSNPKETTIPRQMTRSTFCNGLPNENVNKNQAQTP
jgi:hypothetical protein